MERTKRTDSLREMIYNAPYELCIERARYYTESYRETEGADPAIRAAKALDKTLRNMSIYILDQERIVGNRSSKLVGTILPVERGDANVVCRMELRSLRSRVYKPFKIDPQDERALKKDLLPYWKGKTVHEMKRESWKRHGLFWEADWGLKQWIRRYKQFGGKWVKDFLGLLVKGRLLRLKESQAALNTNNPNLVNNIFDTQGHLVMGHNNLLVMGYGGLRQKVLARLDDVGRAVGGVGQEEQAPVLAKGACTGCRRSTAQTDADWQVRREFEALFPKGQISGHNKAFLEAVLISIDAAAAFIERFAALAREKAGKEGDGARRDELLGIATTCDHLRTQPPRTFREALQLVWFNHGIATISYGMGSVLAVGRSDQYLYPFYQKDIAAGLISDGEVTELIEEFLIKLSYNLLMLPNYGKATASELGGDNAAITVGGIGQDGKDATNALSHLCMDAIENIKSMTTSFSIRFSPSLSPRAWVDRAMRVFSRTSGPAIFNDDVIIPALLATGVSLEDARDYAMIGCVEPSPQGNAFATTSGNDISLVGLLELVLTNGKLRNSGVKHGIETGMPDRFTSYDDILSAFEEQMSYLVDHIAKCVDIKDLIYAKYYPNPFISMTMGGCIESATDMTRGGAKYNFSSISARGLATTADSLAALKRVVFDGHQLNMWEMCEALDRNFSGDAMLQNQLRYKTPKFGNDDDFVDCIAKSVAECFCNEVERHPCLRGGLGGGFRPGFFSYGLYVVDGFFLGATPDGRNAGEPVSNSFSPANNAERNGPTAVFNSVAKIDHKRISNGVSLNMRLLPSLIDAPDKQVKFADLVMAYLLKGGTHVQFNVVNQEDLIDAQVHPERHQDLIIRVSGYCAYFVDLGKPVQDDIISRYVFSST
ncbi:MAG: hypothetical protein JW839_14265 [Candidatus Lokiarchaeota archaeon]|nr:hypothetical protein [Candidatus Lokiarchaeota archaeon]